jgi:hypothetical protein
MTQSTDFTARAQAAIEKIADRLPELPKPVLAAIGAADLAGRQLTDLLGRLGDRTGVKAPTMPHRDEVVDELRAAAADLPGKLQQFAGELPQKVQELIAELPAKAKELADELEEFATGLPGKVQKFSDELPGKVSEVGTQLQPEHVKQSAEAYGQLISNVFETLAERGGKTWEDLRKSGPIPGTVVDSPAETSTPAVKTTKPASPKPASAKPASAKPASAESASANPASANPASAKAPTGGSSADSTSKSTTKRPPRRKPSATAKPAAADTSATPGRPQGTGSAN